MDGCFIVYSRIIYVIDQNYGNLSQIDIPENNDFSNSAERSTGLRISGIPAARVGVGIPSNGKIS